MSEPDFDIGMLAHYFLAAARHDKGDIYVHPRWVNLKIGFYVSYELTRLRQEAIKKAAGTNTPPTANTRTVARTATKVRMEVPGAARTFTLPMKYVLQYSDATMTALKPFGPPFEFDLERARTAPDRYRHLTVTRLLGDAVHDEGRELARCGFVYHKDLTEMSASARRAYGKNLGDVTFVPADAAPDSPIYVQPDSKQAAYYSSKGFEFKKLLAQTCTYDASGDYFGKWTADALKEPRRSFVGPNLSTQYLTRATGEYELEQGYYYALLTSPMIQRLYRMSPDGRAGYRLDLMVCAARGTPRAGAGGR